MHDHDRLDAYGTASLLIYAALERESERWSADFCDGMRRAARIVSTAGRDVHRLRFYCAACGTKIAKNRSHALIGEPPYTADRVLCMKCMESTRTLHARYYPDCQVEWHDLHDHPGASADWCSAVYLLSGGVGVSDMPGHRANMIRSPRGSQP